MADTAFPGSTRRVRASGGSSAGFVGMLAFLTLLACGVGAVAGLHLAETVREAAAREARGASASAPAAPVYAVNARLRGLKPLVTNLAAPRDAWIRLQASIVLDDGDVEEAGMLAGRIEEDVVAYLRTITLSQVEGAAGLQHLREDLNERAVARSGGRVRELILESLVIQ
ncbi:flagellar basal body-associated FliL family protein [Polymorphum gilvum]|uniref:Flagellar protein FliL n=1 Tax=Polymorphum gilvum (strain LMG 25793 / CGMCC 1.9160 / SL003B-26A1) TaxID=991905 RepID=F2J5D4_POLGS|nr:flagellar basal body-associated FliL family protein [Polymorphum gilvum]ADZ72304.1 Flagellar basal body-associated protein FliL [Polymorphum gilvum SL003B-26A1]